MNRKTILLLTIFFLGGFVYGAMVGKYSIFPFSIIKKFQDRMMPDDLDIAISPVNAEAVLDDYKDQDLDALIRIKSKDGVDSVRRDATTLIFGYDSLPASLPDMVIDTTDERYSDLENLSGIKKFTINMSSGINSVGYIFTPSVSNNRLLVYHQGHEGDFLFGKGTIRYYLMKGYTVYAFCMPLMGLNNNPVVTLNIGTVRLRDHDQMQFLDYPLAYFMQPVVTMINYAEKNYAFEHVTMTGISGGGWTTVLCAAIDTRIDHSIPVAGSYPMYIRFSDMQDWGDFEQFNPNFYNTIDYLDLYILNATGNGGKRKFSQVFNKHDPCCFAGEKYKHYFDKINAIINEIGGEYEVILDTENKVHSISPYALDEVNKSQ